MKKTIFATTIAALLATSALPAVASNSGLNLDLGLDSAISLDSDLLTAQTDVGVDANVDASEDGLNVDAGVGADAEVDADDSLDAAAGVDASTTASVDAEDNSFDSLSAAIATSADFDLSVVTDEEDVTIVLVSGLEGDIAVDGAGLDEELAAHADAHATLHANIDGNAAIKAKLEAEGFAAADVVAVKSKADGSVLVYVDDRA
jgi:hypothetical protein